MESIYKHIRYFKYVLKHKWYVFLECCKMGMPWRGLVHDWSKFTWAEWLPYVNTFGVKKKSPRDKLGAYDPSKVSPEFDWAWNHHVHANAYHWQYYILLGDAEKLYVINKNNDAFEKSVPGFKVLPMPLKYIKEMVCDWRGAGRAQGTKEPIEWYSKNHSKMILHPESRKVVEYLLIKDVVTDNKKFGYTLLQVDNKYKFSGTVEALRVGRKIWDMYVLWLRGATEDKSFPEYTPLLGLIGRRFFGIDIIQDDLDHYCIYPVDKGGFVVWDAFNVINSE